MSDDREKQQKRAYREYLFAAIGFTCAVPAYIWFGNSDLAADSDRAKWFAFISAGGFGLMACLAWYSYLKKLSMHASDDLIKTAVWLVILLAASAAVLFYAVGWLASIPSWAAVIIVLLFLILLAIVFTRRR